MMILTGIDPSDEQLMLGMDHDAWRELGVDSGILRAKLLLIQRKRLLECGTEFQIAGVSCYLQLLMSTNSIA